MVDLSETDLEPRLRRLERYVLPGKNPGGGLTISNGDLTAYDHDHAGESLSPTVVNNTDYNEAVSAEGVVAGAVDLDLAGANLFTATLGGNTTFDIINATVDPAGNSLSLLITQDAATQYTLTWPASVEWDGGAPPADPALGEQLEVAFISYDGGQTWKGRESGRAFA